MIVKKAVRDQVYTIETYLKYVNDGDICETADVQRLAGNFDKREVNEIIYTTLTGDHIPELILAECKEDNRTYIADGLQRTTMLKWFKNGYRITSAIDNPVVAYMAKKRDENGNIIKNERGQVEYEEANFDIRNKTIDDLPDELKKEFNDFQLRVVIHENCTMKRISELIKRYNYQKAMTPSQKAFTYMDNFAIKTRDISNNKFFVECEGYTEKEKINGTIERVITESIMHIFHFDNWKTSPRSICEYLNKYANEKEFEFFDDLTKRLGNVITPEFNNIFVSKNSFVWFKLFYLFIQFGIGDERFPEFLYEFNNRLKDKIVDGIEYKNMDNITYAKLDRENGTKDRVLVSAKIRILEKLMREYFGVCDSDISKDIIIEEFISENLSMDIETVREDMDVYNETLDNIAFKTIKYGSKLLEDSNRPSLLAMIAYSYKKDKDLDEWMMEYALKNDTYDTDQKRNYLHMKKDFEDFIKNKEEKQKTGDVNKK